MDFQSWSSLENFSREELACKCKNKSCESVPMNYDFMARLQQLRTEIDARFTITSGYRCYDHEVDVGGSGSNHPKGKAVDIVANRSAMSKIVAKAADFGFTGIGVSLHGPNKFIHLDTTHKDLTVWSY